ncbi:DNA replication protein psf2 [Apiospora arundinis]
MSVSVSSSSAEFLTQPHCNTSSISGSSDLMSGSAPASVSSDTFEPLGSLTRTMCREPVSPEEESDTLLLLWRGLLKMPSDDAFLMAWNDTAGVAQLSVSSGHTEMPYWDVAAAKSDAVEVDASISRACFASGAE